MGYRRVEDEYDHGMFGTVFGGFGTGLQDCGGGVWAGCTGQEGRKAQEGSGRLRKAQEGSARAQEGSGRAQEELRKAEV